MRTLGTVLGTNGSSLKKSQRFQMLISMLWRRESAGLIKISYVLAVFLATPAQTSVSGADTRRSWRSPTAMARGTRMGEINAVYRAAAGFCCQMVSLQVAQPPPIYIAGVNYNETEIIRDAIFAWKINDWGFSHPRKPNNSVNLS